MRSNLVHGKVCSITTLRESDFRQISGFLRVLRFPPPIKLTVESYVKYNNPNPIFYRYANPGGVGIKRLRVKLPDGLQCTQCVLQWKWHAGNTIYYHIFISNNVSFVHT